MFGSNDNSSLPNDPAMLDNVKELASQPVNQVVPPAHPPADDAVAAAPPTPQSAPADPTPAPADPSAPSVAPTSFTPDVTAPAAADPVTQSQPAVEPSQSGFDPLQSGGAGITTAPASESVAATPADPLAAASVDPVAVNPIVEDIDEHLNRLSELKQKAMDELEPLSGHLESTPEETFKMTMMMIQANDNHHLLEKALESAQGIKDDKARAQAMLEVINEINYFSQVTPLDGGQNTEISSS